MPTTRRTAAALAVAGLVVVSLNQRPAVASIGPVLDEIRRSLHLTGAEASILTAAPVFAFGLLAPVGRWLERRLGLRSTIIALSLVLLIGLVVRLGPDAGTLFLGTIVAAAAIAGLNVVLPVFVRLEWPERTGLMMGIYTTFLTGSAAAAAGLTVPLQHAFAGTWRAGLAPWAVLAAAGFTIWIPVWRAPRLPASISAESAVVNEASGAGDVRLRSDRLAWLVTGYFGLQSAGFYAVLTWLPTLFTDHGMTATKAGALLSLSAFVQTPVALVTPALATRMRQQSGLVALSCLFTAVGFLLLVVAPVSAAYVAVVILGIGQGAAFPLSLTILVLRAPTPKATTPLSSMVQTIGYLMAAPGPLLVGLLHSATGGWTVPMTLLLALVVPQLLCGVLAGIPRRAA